MRKTILVAVAAAALVLTAGCRLESEKKPTDSRPHNEADVAFAEMMIPHHEQAIEMTKLAATRADSQEVKDLAGQIQAAQDPEIATMQEWLKNWGEDGMSHEMTHDDMPGMVDDKTMGELGKASGPEFDRLFLTSMIAHHEGAVAMAQSEKSDGIHKGAIALAADIIRTQTSEIQKMQGMLN